MFIAIMESETATWHGIGTTEKEAKDCIKKAWKADSHTDKTVDLEDCMGSSALRLK